MKNKLLYDEQELLVRVAAGEQQAFAMLVDQYTDIVYPYLVYWFKQARLAEELTQDIFLRVWRNRHKLAGMENFPGYLYVITRNRANSAFKEQLLNTEELNPDKLENLLQQPQSTLESKELVNILQLAIDSLPPRRKEVFLLSRVEDLTYEEIAEKLSISRSAVRQHIVEALVFLRHYLKEHAGIIVSLLPWFLYRLQLFLIFF